MEGTTSVCFNNQIMFMHLWRDLKSYIQIRNQMTIYWCQDIVLVQYIGIFPKILIFGTYSFISSLPPIFPFNQNYFRANEFCHWNKYLIRPKLSTSGKSCPNIYIIKLPYKLLHSRIKAILHYNCNCMVLFSFMFLCLKNLIQLIVVKYAWFF